MYHVIIYEDENGKSDLKDFLKDLKCRSETKKREDKSE